MTRKPTRFSSILYTGLLLFVLLSSCVHKKENIDQDIKKQFQVADSLLLTGQGLKSIKLLHTIRPKVSSNDPLITAYYRNISQSHYNDTVQMNIYADSALAFFNTNARKTQYPDEYFKALIAKGDAFFRSKKYISALKYYYRSKKVLATGSCDDGLLASKLSIIYFGQGNYREAARYSIESFNRFSLCNGHHNAEYAFLRKQGDLNNTGFAYQKAGMLDSAMNYYMRDLNFINQSEKEQKFTEINLQAARTVVYDNIGGIYLKKGNLGMAEDYLTKCLAIAHDTTDGMMIPPMLKLAELYLKTDNMDKALAFFKSSKPLLDRFCKDNPEYYLLWNKYFAEYQFKLNQPAKAYEYQNNYIRLRDSIERGTSDLYRLDVERELNNIQQENDLNELARQNQVKVIYLTGIGITVLLSLVIIALINRNLKRIQKNHRETTAHNHKLQHTLDELERVNKNYIRIMRVMAHDLRNPLSGITGLANLMLDDEEFNDDNKHMLKLIETTGIHSLEMINELLKSGLADENEVVITELLDLRSMLFDSVELLQFKATEKDQRLIFENDEEPIMANVNHEKIWRVFNNLIVNAIKFSHTGGLIHVGVKHKGNNVLVWVSDSGVGIPDKDKDNVFEMFTPAKKEGTNGEQPFGLGLSISKKIVEKHDGKIWFESTAGVGTQFYVELPGA